MGELYVIESNAADWQEAIKLTADELRKHGCVREDFYESCVEREKEYPTGLIETCPVALPHTSKDFVLKEAVCCLRLKEPVKFRSMEDMNKEIGVRIVLNMALLDDAEHILIISRIINSLKKPNFVDILLTMPKKELLEFLKETLFQEEKKEYVDERSIWNR